jgi:hypothetical protein
MIPPFLSWIPGDVKQFLSCLFRAATGLIAASVKKMDNTSSRGCSMFTVGILVSSVPTLPTVTLPMLAPLDSPDLRLPGGATNGMDGASMS